MDKPIKSFQGHTVSLLSALKNALISCSFYLLKQGNNTISIPPLSTPSPPPPPLHPQLHCPWYWRCWGWQITVPGKFWSDLKILKVFIIGQKLSFLCLGFLTATLFPWSFISPTQWDGKKEDPWECVFVLQLVLVEFGGFECFLLNFVLIGSFLWESNRNIGLLLTFFDETFAMTWLSSFNCRVMLMQSNGIHKGRY